MQINLKTFYPLDTQSIIHSSNKAFFMERQRKHNFSSRISAQGSRFIFTDDCGEQRCVIVYVCVRKDTHTQLHAKTLWVQTHRWGDCCSRSPGSVSEAASLKKFELFLKIVKICYLCCCGGGELRPGSSPSSSRPSPSCPSSSS